MNAAIARRPRRLLATTLVIGSVALFVVVLAVYFTRGFVPGDSIVYLAGGERLNAGHPLYALSPGDRVVGVKPPYWTVPLLSPPFIAVVFRPLALLPSDLGAYLWWIGTMSAITAVLVAYFRRRPVLASLALIVLVVPITYEVGVGNVNAFLLLGSVLIWRWSLEGHDERSGIATALMVFVKVSPVVLAWWLLTQRRWGAVRAGLVAGVILLGVSILGAGIDAHLRYLEITRETTTIGQSDLSLGGLARAIGVAPSVADLLPIAMLVGGVLGIVLLRNRPGPAFALAVATMTLGSPVVNINSYALLLGCLAPAMWSPRIPSISTTVPGPKSV
ncbi:MAG: glycosyltransferase 87 family protein [Candidatus Limnocylindrales bacterium]